MGFTDVLGAISAPVEAIGSVATALINRHSQKETNKRNQEENEINRQFNAQQSDLERKFNSYEAEKSRLFNSSEAQKSRLFNADQAAKQMQFEREMWNSENAYNEPSAQIARLKAAGLNPNLFGGDNTAGSAGSGVAASSSPASSSPASSKALGASGSIPMQPPQLGNASLQAAQIRLANAQAEKAESDAQRTQTLLPGEVRTQDMNCRVMDSNIRVNDATVQKLGADVSSIDQQIAQSKEYSHLLSLQGQAQQKELDAFGDKFRMIVEKHAQDLKESNSRIRLNRESIDELASRAKLNLSQAQNANDVHLLNGANLKFMADGGEEFLISCRWDEELKKYSTFIQDFTLRHEQFKTGMEKTKHERKLLNDRKTWYGQGLDWIGQTVDALGSPFGAGVNYGVHQSSSHSDIDVRGNSNVTTKKAFDFIP